MLENPTQSSDLNELYPASNPLNRQDRVERKKQGLDWWTSSFPVSKDDKTINNPDNIRAQTSCAITKAVSASQPEAWWQADFIGGDHTISEVEVFGEHYHTIWDRAMLGVDVFIGDQHCNVIDGETMTEMWITMKLKEGNGYRIQCKQPLTGNSVKLVSRVAPREGEQYTAGLTLCDIRVFTPAREPTFNGHYKCFGKPRDFDKFPQREDYGELLQNTSFGEGRSGESHFIKGEFDVEDR